jgi:hypothetical protein
LLYPLPTIRRLKPTARDKAPIKAGGLCIDLSITVRLSDQSRINAVDLFIALSIAVRLSERIEINN